MEGLSVWVFARAPLSNNTPQVQGCGVVHQTRLIEEYDAAQHEADVEYLEVVAFLTFCAVGPSQVDHDGGRTLAVGEHAEPSAASDALGARDRHTIFSHTLLSTYILPPRTFVHPHGIKTDIQVVCRN